jgi:hypothetical protein
MSRAFALTGTHQREPEPVRLTAGPLTAELVNGNLRTISHGGTEVLRAIAYIVRDRDWGTYEPAIINFRLDQGEEKFSLSYDAECTGPDGARLRFSARIVGSVNELIFTATATPDGDFETNRCGFCILHPIVGLSGSPVSVEHVDGSVVETVLPELIDPWQPFRDMRAITHTVRPGLTAECRMEGDAFEMEDQRNWSDASYKTYVRPLALPWPYVLSSGKPQTQTITLRFSGDGRGASASGRATSRLRPELRGTGPALPKIGVAIYPQDVPAALAHLERLRELSPQALLLHFDPTAGHSAREMNAFAELGRAYPAEVTLECAVPCKDDLGVEMASVAALVRDAGLTLDNLVVSPSVDRQSTPPGSKWPDCPPLEDVYAAARRAFPDVRLGGGMLSYFTELNRKRVPPEQLDFITHCTCPIVHASDDLSVMQSLEALTPVTRSVQAIYGGKPYRIGPSTIAMRQNPYGSATKDNPNLSRIAMASRDPRHNALFGAAWAVGYAARVAPTGLEQLVLSAFAGPFGLIAGVGEPVGEGGKRPLFHVVKALAGLAGLQAVSVDTGDDTRLAVVAAHKPDDSIVALAANLTPYPLEIDLSGLAEQGAKATILDGESIGSAEGWRAAGAALGGLVLQPYAVAKIG